MKKFLVTADLDYIIGHLRYGHLEGIVEAESEKALREMMTKKDFRTYLDLLVDDYRVEDYGCIDKYRYEYEEVE